MNRQKLSHSLINLKNEFGTEKVYAAVEAVEKFQVEVPSWIFGKFGGGRFGAVGNS